MKIILSPAKKMVVDADGIDVLGLPYFIDEAKELREYLKSLSYDELKELWKCNDKITLENVLRLEKLKIDGVLTPAVLAYDGIAYKNMAPSVFTYDEWDYLDKHLYILSGLYGALRSRDGVIPYRLEMEARIDFNGYKSLYDYWSDKIYNYIKDDIIINLASKEYSDAVRPYLSKDVKMINIVFLCEHNKKLVTKPTEAKANRGAMVRFMAENKIEDINDIKLYNRNGYKYNDDLSDDLNIVFVKE